MPIRLRLTLAFAGLMAVVLATAGWILFTRFRADLDHTIDDGLREQARTLAEVLDRPGLRLGIESILIAPTKPFVQVYGPTGFLFVSAGISGPIVPPKQIATLRSPTFLEKTIVTPQGDVEARFYLTRTGGRVFLVGDSLEERSSALHSLALQLAIGMPVALATATGIAWLMATAALRPVERMRAEAAAITAAAAERRLTVPEGGDEVSRLGETLNDMLDRLEGALERERRFVDDASHELRTPLGTLRMELELALRGARTNDELVAALSSAMEESERLSRLAEDLLVLARVKGGRLPVRATQVDLGTLVGEVTGSFTARAEQRGIGIVNAVEPGTHVRVDPDRIRQALDNLVENALRATPPDGRVTIGAQTGPGRLAISVGDTGPGFPPDFLARAFEPFARPDGARGRDGGGTGLGLAIVRAAAEAHGGEAVAENDPAGGAVVRILLPL